MAGRGAWRQWRHRRLPRSSARMPPHIALAMHRRFLAPVPVGAALKTPAASNLRAPTRPMARAPVGNAKTHSTPSHYDGVEHKWWLPSPPPPPPPPPWASSRRPRHHIRRRLRRATRCVGAFAAAPAQHARALRAIVLRARAGPDLGVRAQLLRSARASRRAAKMARASRWQMERWLEAAPSFDAPGAGRSGAEDARVRARARTQKKRLDEDD